MAQITSLYVYKVLSLATSGVETGDLMGKLGLSMEGPIDPTQMVSSSEYYDFFAALVDRDPNGLLLPLKIGASMRSDEYGAFGLAWKSAPTLRGSFKRAERYGHVLGSAETYSLEETAEGFLFNLEKAGDGCPGMLLSNEASMAAVNTISREVSSSNFVPLAICFKHAPRGDTRVYETHFGCPVHFETGRDAVLASKESIESPNKLGDETIARFFDQHLEQQLNSLKSDIDLQQQVRRVVVNVLSEGVPRLSRIASELKMGARTLQRRLSEQGYSFQNVVDMAQRDLAQRLLRETDYSLAEVAFLTGFAEQSGFTRAFKRWAGQTPRSYRLSYRRC
ncbi:MULTISPECIES: AraC family transcriptional regulator [Marinobacter]|uniref:AraC family transcriptional regulator n=1 Tax=Marinobacter TaxID=2742 RepID=UPI001B217E83|nr:AraC family transcriptional regulator [Marinobacter sp.]MBO6812139.1 AraC family transcriptional regulator [Marinobacter sp.]MBO6873613.1 AraC family transcriptional regulator [Marinobacter sp.]